MSHLFPTTLMCLLLGLSVCGCESADSPTPPADNSLTLKSEDEIRSEYGIPADEWDGAFGGDYYEGEIKTLVFDQTGGSLYLTFEKRGDDWIVITNAWLPEGAVF